MEIKTEKIKHVTLICVQGRLDSSTSPNLETHLLPLVLTEQLLVLDLAGVEYVSSAGLRVFLLIAKTSLKNPCGFVICGVRDNIAQLIEMSGFSSILKIKATREEAFASD
jgi:anti-anti-sigma factor